MMFASPKDAHNYSECDLLPEIRDPTGRIGDWKGRRMVQVARPAMR